MLRVAINGLGRIGRAPLKILWFARHCESRGQSNVQRVDRRRRRINRQTFPLARVGRFGATASAGFCREG